MRTLIGSFLLVLLLSGFPESSFGQAVKIDTLKFKPSEYPGLPSPVAAWLEERGMVIPQARFGQPGLPDNVLQGEFFKPGQTDWAVLVTDEDSLWVWIFPEGKVDNPSLMIAEQNLYHGKSLWFSWGKDNNIRAFGFYISKLSENKLENTRNIVNSRDNFGMPAVMPDFDHQGISFRMIDAPGWGQYYNHCGVWMYLFVYND